MNENRGKSMDVLERVLGPVPDIAANDTSVLCRLCANPNDKIIGIYSEEGLSNELSNKMNLYLPIKVSETDSLPLHCCWTCASTILAWHELVVVSVDSDRRLRGILHGEDKYNDVDIYENYEEATHLAEDERFELKSPASDLHVFYQGSSSDTEQPKTAPSKQRCKTNNSKKQYLVQCNVIADEALLKYLENIQNPILETNPSLDVSEKFNTPCSTYTPVEDSDSSLVSYPLKSQSSETLPQTVKIEGLSTYQKQKETNKADVDPLHLPLRTVSTELKEEYNFSCQYCTLMFVSEVDILEHVKIKHSNIHLEDDNLATTSASKKKKLRCKKLDQGVINAAKFVIDGRIYYSCKVCGKVLHSPYTYIWHIRIHTGERPYVCDLCGKQFRISQGLVRHVKETHQGVKNFGCDICGRMFATRRNVQEHRRIHTNERPYVCDLCGKSFKQKASLFVHNRSHSDSFPYICTYCKQGFRARPPLLIHMTRHTGEKPYPCDTCGRSFRIKYELKRHKLVHSEEKPFSCGECGLHFRQKRYLRNHNKTNHKQLTVDAEVMHFVS